ncbi:predicted protein [Plenodomus lingam JN3]|uniref:Predicted protein n=1 Tax=Leptosphaeria maculans (strain JN3 / isolate v23.1.3 / race Av1-4-5-6-7-8) TaxID=985895 RepID=E4ZRF6_LEPMJ|nr:predicted protein [Plenodomus lingam JN3]CBX94150.1 predicted protein [Plenodomus lingam JN3]
MGAEAGAGGVAPVMEMGKSTLLAYSPSAHALRLMEHLLMLLLTQKGLLLGGPLPILKSGSCEQILRKF